MEAHLFPWILNGRRMQMFSQASTDREKTSKIEEADETSEGDWLCQCSVQLQFISYRINTVHSGKANFPTMLPDDEHQINCVSNHLLYLVAARWLVEFTC